ncbi:hypothetical protein JRQ81_012206 [Phrynocephalus forsythii]|uniref:Uncharacterized protein n=1 Tax=Phrynocephalus forsythii TaxID=171643 RepID=A0A9Q1AQB7_9SAUR|nr:hypothetical protein JRQ81_012206 [Phrynocephalus forsythii]
MGSQIKRVTSQGGGNQVEDPPRATRRISRKNGRKTLQEGSWSREKLGDQPLKTEEAPSTGLTGGLSASVHQSSNVRTSNKRPLVSRYGRKYHYLHELDIADSREDHVESWTSEENLQQRSPCDKQDRKLTGKSKLESYEDSLEGKQRNHLEEKFPNLPKHGNRLSGANSLERNQKIQSERSSTDVLAAGNFPEREQLIGHKQECSVLFCLPGGFKGGPVESTFLKKLAVKDGGVKEKYVSIEL